jgi:hypothetical protein
MQSEDQKEADQAIQGKLLETKHRHLGGLNLTLYHIEWLSEYVYTSLVSALVLAKPRSSMLRLRNCIKILSFCVPEYQKTETSGQELGECLRLNRS